jgi:hypothetical protein
MLLSLYVRSSLSAYGPLSLRMLLSLYVSLYVCSSLSLCMLLSLKHVTRLLSMRPKEAYGGGGSKKKLHTLHSELVDEALSC